MQGEIHGERAYAAAARSRKSERSAQLCEWLRAGAPRENATQAQVTPEVTVMREQRAREILQSLIQGVNPFDGEELPDGSILQQADVLRALLAGVAALEDGEARAERRAQMPENMGRPWNDEEQELLVTAFHAGEPLSDIALRHRRTLRAIEARLEKFGLISADQRATRDRFTSATPPERSG
jgi:hypothetical protein